MKRIVLAKTPNIRRDMSDLLRHRNKIGAESVLVTTHGYKVEEILARSGDEHVLIVSNLTYGGGESALSLAERIKSAYPRCWFILMRLPSEIADIRSVHIDGYVPVDFTSTRKMAPACQIIETDWTGRKLEEIEQTIPHVRIMNTKPS